MENDLLEKVLMKEDSTKKDPVEECLGAVLGFVDTDKYPNAEKTIRLMLQILFLAGKIQRTLEL